MSALFTEILHRPLFNGLVVLYNTVAFADLGLAIIFFTIVIRFILFPLFHESLRHQRLTQELQPEIKKIQEKHKDNREEQTKEILALYKKYKANPLTPILLIILQLPILFYLFRIFNEGFTEEAFSLLYSFVTRPEVISNSFLGMVDLTSRSVLIVLLAALAQYVQSKFSLPKLKKEQVLSQAEKIGRNMVYIGPIITVVILVNLPAALGLYWLTSTGFSIIQQIAINRLFKDGKIKGENK